MAVTLEMPQEEFEVSTAGPAPAESEQAGAALKLLTGDDVEAGVNEGEDKEITITLVKDVEDPVVGFAASKGTTFTAGVDEDGATYIPWQYQGTPDCRVYLEAEEFQEVIPLNGDQFVSEDAAALAAGDESAVNATEQQAQNEAQQNEATQPPTGAPMDASSPPVLPTGTDPAKSVDQQAAALPAESAAGSAVAVAVAPAVVPVKLTARQQYLREKDVLQEQLGALMMELAHLKEQQKETKKEAEVVTTKLADLIRDWESRDDDEDAVTGSSSTTAATTATAGGASETLSVSSGKSTQTGSSPGTASQPQSEAEMRAKLAAAGEPTVSQGQVAAVETAKPARDEAAEQARYEAVLKAASIAELSLAPKVQERLEEAGATNIWKLEQLRADIALGREKWPKGIGAAKITDIEDALMQWMSRNQDTWAANQREAIAEEAAGHPQPRTQAEIDATNAELQAQQGKQKDAPQAETVCQHGGKIRDAALGDDASCGCTNHPGPQHGQPRVAAKPPAEASPTITIDDL